MNVVEVVARAICIAEGVDPDASTVGMGFYLPEGKNALLWEARANAARAAITALHDGLASELAEGTQGAFHDALMG